VDFFSHFGIFIDDACAQKWQWRRRLEWGSRCWRGGGYIALAINLELARVVSSAIGFNASVGVQRREQTLAAGATVSGGFDGKRYRRSAFCLQVASRWVHDTRGRTRSLFAQCPARRIGMPNLGRGPTDASGRTGRSICIALLERVRVVHPSTRTKTDSPGPDRSARWKCPYVISNAWLLFCCLISMYVSTMRDF
jgi:hypothetical protein